MKHTGLYKPKSIRSVITEMTLEIKCPNIR